MSLDYQQILLEMNRPRRRQSGSMSRKLAYFALFLALAGAGGAAWKFGYVDYVEYAGEKGRDLYASVKGWIAERSGMEIDAPADTAAVADMEDQIGPEKPDAGGFSLPTPPPSGPVDVVEAEGVAPRRFSSDPVRAGIMPGDAENSREDGAIAGLTPAAGPSATPVAVPAPTREPKPEAKPAPAAVPADDAASPASATPVLSEPREQLKHIDRLLASDPAEAMRRAEELLASRKLAPDEAAEGGYRLGYAARLMKDEEKAERSWRETAEKWPGTRGGRYSALALADTWFHRHATTRPNMARWDEIQVFYSRVIGGDDAPFLSEEVKARVKKNLNVLNDALFFGSAPTSLARYHKVESGELLGSIARIYRVDYESLARVNGINPNRIRAGMDLKVVTGDVAIVVRKHEKDPSRTPTVTWFVDGRWVREYPACIGSGVKTPAGRYELTSKERDPSWTNPVNGQLLANDHPENILGTRWMAMKGMNTTGLGIHGTTVPDSIPGYASAGCVRLLNKDVEELFSFARIGASVTIVE